MLGLILLYVIILGSLQYDVTTSLVVIVVYVRQAC
jgi:hypothetical protein